MRLILTWMIGGTLAFSVGCSDDGVPQSDTSATDGSFSSTSGDPGGTAAGESDGDTASGGSATDPTDSTGPSDSGGTTGADDGTTGGTGSSTGPDTDTDTDTDTGGSSTGGSSTGESSTGGSSSTGAEGLAIGEDCTSDEDCASGVCWDFSDYDKACFGAVCSATCKSSDECAEAFEAAGAPTPKGATCGKDGRCDPVGSGFGNFACAAK